MRQSYKDEIDHIKKISQDMIKCFEFDGEFDKGFRRIPAEYEINGWALEIDKSIMCDSKRVRSEVLELTMWMYEFAHRLCQTTTVSKEVIEQARRENKSEIKDISDDELRIIIGMIECELIDRKQLECDILSTKKKVL